MNEGRNKTSLKWYNPQNMLGFSAESNIPADELIQAFSEMDGHLPIFEPTWVPEGFELIIQEGDLGSTSYAYMHPTTGNVIVLQYYDYGNIDQFTGFFTEADVSEEISINGFRAILGYTDIGSPDYDPKNIYNGLSIIWVDDVNHLIFAVDSSIDRDESIMFAESIRAK